MIKKTATNSKVKRKKPGSTCCVVNSCLGKIAGVVNILTNYSVHQNALALDMIQVFDGMNYFQSC